MAGRRRPLVTDVVRNDAANVDSHGSENKLSTTCIETAYGV